MQGIIIGILEQGFIYGIMALGVYISYKILDFPDLSADGTFPLGAAVSATLIAGKVNPWLTLLIAFVAGALAGMLTGFFNVKLKIKDLLAGILTMTLLYSVNYRIVGGPNLFLMGEETIFSNVKGMYMALVLIIVISIAIKLILDLYLKTKSGFVLKCIGTNEQLAVTMGLNPGTYKIIGLAIGNGLIALSGALYAQKTNQFDISIGVGTMVMGLAAVILGGAFLKKLKFLRATTAVLIGMILYKACISIAISSGLQSSDMNLVITVLFIVTLVINKPINLRRGGNKNA